MNFGDKAHNLQRTLLDEALSKGIQRNEEQRKIWAAYKEGHSKVAEALHAFPKDLYTNCMVPIGKRALMKGKLIHTNEVLASLGDGYFAKYSATGAIALCNRRMQRADEMLENLAKERDLYETRLMVIKGGVFDNCPGREIVEHWNEEEIDNWRKKHRAREKEYHQRLAILRQEETKKIETEEDLFHRLDQLEIEEELADELNRLEDEHYELFGEELEEDDYSESESSSENEEEITREEEHSLSEKHSEPEKLSEFEKQSGPENNSKEKVESCKIKKSVSFAEPGDDVNEKKIEDSTSRENTSSKDGGDSEEILRIEFSHSSNTPETKSEGNSIETPADIYRFYSKVKSILKRSPNDIPVQAIPSNYSTEEEEEEEEETVKSSAYETVVKDIKERDTTSLVNAPAKTDAITRPVSKFKRDRQLKQ